MNERGPHDGSPWLSPDATHVVVPAPPSSSGMMNAHPSTDARASLAFALGVASFVCGGFLTGIPAIFLGLMARREIDRSNGTLTGAPLATAGIITGTAGSIVSFAAIAAIAFILLRAPAAPEPQSTQLYEPEYIPSQSQQPLHPMPSGPVAIPRPTSFGKIRVVDMESDDKRPFREQLTTEVAHDVAAKKTVIVATTASWCSACAEVETSLLDPRMQELFANVAIIRVDIEDFHDELAGAGMLEQSAPWFYKLDSNAKVVDAINAGEWDENVADNIAPVMKQFLIGKLHDRRERSTVHGTSL